jgi:hypothetical protein
MSEENYGNLETIAKSLRCEFNGRPSWRVMLTKIAKGELFVIKANVPFKDFHVPVPAVPIQMPMQVPVNAPAWNVPVAENTVVPCDD